MNRSAIVVGSAERKAAPAVNQSAIVLGSGTKDFPGKPFHAADWPLSDSDTDDAAVNVMLNFSRPAEAENTAADEFAPPESRTQDSFLSVNNNEEEDSDDELLTLIEAMKNRTAFFQHDDGLPRLSTASSESPTSSVLNQISQLKSQMHSFAVDTTPPKRTPSPPTLALPSDRWLQRATTALVVRLPQPVTPVSTALQLTYQPFDEGIIYCKHRFMKAKFLSWASFARWQKLFRDYEVVYRRHAGEAMDHWDRSCRKRVFVAWRTVVVTRRQRCDSLQSKRKVQCLQRAFVVWQEKARWAQEISVAASLHRKRTLLQRCFMRWLQQQCQQAATKQHQQAAMAQEKQARRLMERHSLDRAWRHWQQARVERMARQVAGAKLVKQAFVQWMKCMSDNNARKELQRRVDQLRKKKQMQLEEEKREAEADIFHCRRWFRRWQSRARQVVLEREDLAKKQAEEAKEEQARKEEEVKKEQARKEEEIRKEEEAKKEQARKEEEIRKEEEAKKEQLRKEEKVKREQERKEEEAKKEQARKEEKMRKEEEVKKEQARKEEEMRMEEEARKEEEMRKEEEIRKEEEAKKEQLRKEEKVKKEQERKEEEAKKEQARKEEEMRKEEEVKKEQARKEEEAKKEQARRAEETRVAQMENARTQRAQEEEKANARTMLVEAAFLRQVKRRKQREQELVHCCFSQWRALQLGNKTRVARFAAKSDKVALRCLWMKWRRRATISTTLRRKEQQAVNTQMHFLLQRMWCVWVSASMVSRCRRAQQAGVRKRCFQVWANAAVASQMERKAKSVAILRSQQRAWQVWRLHVQQRRAEHQRKMTLMRVAFVAWQRGVLLDKHYRKQLVRHSFYVWAWHTDERASWRQHSERIAVRFRRQQLLAVCLGEWRQLRGRVARDNHIVTTMVRERDRLTLFVYFQHWLRLAAAKNHYQQILLRRAYTLWRNMWAGRLLEKSGCLEGASAMVVLTSNAHGKQRHSVPSLSASSSSSSPSLAFSVAAVAETTSLSLPSSSILPAPNLSSSYWSSGPLPALTNLPSQLFPSPSPSLATAAASSASSAALRSFESQPSSSFSSESHLAPDNPATSNAAVHTSIQRSYDNTNTSSSNNSNNNDTKPQPGSIGRHSFPSSANIIACHSLPRAACSGSYTHSTTEFSSPTVLSSSSPSVLLPSSSSLRSCAVVNCTTTTSPSSQSQYVAPLAARTELAVTQSRQTRTISNASLPRRDVSFSAPFSSSSWLPASSMHYPFSSTVAGSQSFLLSTEEDRLRRWRMRAEYLALCLTHNY